MMKEALMVGGSAALAGVIVGKWGGPIESAAVSAHIPPVFAHAAVVMAATVGTFLVLRHVL